MFDFLTPYLDMYRTESRKLFSRPVKISKQTCPVCDRKNVNIYYSSQLDKYICKQCMDKLIGGNKDEVGNV